MLSLERTNRFKKDVNRMLKRGKRLEKLQSVVVKLIKQQPLEIKYCDHALSGNFNYARECHIEPDWLLIYTQTQTMLRLERTGSHADLFK